MMDRDQLRQNIRTIIVVMMENRSFDHVLGHMRLPGYGNRQDVEGITQVGSVTYMNPAGDGTLIPLFLADDGQLISDLPHDKGSVRTQLAQAHGQYAMNGFVQAYEQFNKSSLDQPPVMSILKPNAVPITRFLADRYMVCNRWFASLPTSTQPNRLMLMSGYSQLSDSGSTPLPDQDTVIDWLTNHHVGWRVYSGGLSFFTLMPRLSPWLLTTHFRDLDDFSRDILKDNDEDWPHVIFIEPEYEDAPIHIHHPCDNHPPLSMAYGEAFLAGILKALASNSERWKQTLLVLTYDEHGGFFDHVPPLNIPYTDNEGGINFDSTGVRVPAVVSSPFVPPSSVSNINLDHTSILQLLAERFGEPGEAYSAAVDARRQAGIGSLSLALDAVAHDMSVPAPPAFSATAEVTLNTSRAPNTANQQAFAASARTLLSRHGAEALAKYPGLARFR